jgi:hypothetical protein
MKRKAAIISSIVFLFFGCNFAKHKETKNMAEYSVSKLSQPVKIDGDWNKPQWQNIKEVNISNRMGDKPIFTPTVKAKMMYDNENLYVIFHVNDKYVRCLVTDINGPVYEEPAVEFFFSPDPEFHDRYFNLEINCGGTPLMHYNDFAAKTRNPLDPEDIKKVEIAHSLPQVVDPEITEPVAWTLEYKIPIAMLEKYSRIIHPKEGINWKANFYNIAEKGSNIHFLTWSFVDNPVPNFHLPRFFGVIKFK